MSGTHNLSVPECAQDAGRRSIVTAREENRPPTHRRAPTHRPAAPPLNWQLRVARPAHSRSSFVSRELRLFRRPAGQSLEAGPRAG